MLGYVITEDVGSIAGVCTATSNSGAKRSTYGHVLKAKPVEKISAKGPRPESWWVKCGSIVSGYSYTELNGQQLAAISSLLIKREKKQKEDEKPKENSSQGGSMTLLTLVVVFFAGMLARQLIFSMWYAISEKLQPAQRARDMAIRELVQSEMKLAQTDIRKMEEQRIREYIHEALRSSKQQ